MFAVKQISVNSVLKSSCCLVLLAKQYTLKFNRNGSRSLS